MRRFPLFILVVILASCSTGNESSEMNAEDIAGTYAGVIPCADCEGIDYRVTLEEDYTFSEQMDYIGKSANALTTTGSYSIEDGIITLKKPTDSFNKFAEHTEGLLMLDREGNVIAGSTADMYILPLVDENTDMSQTGSPAIPDTTIKPRQDNTEVDEVSRAKINRHIKGWKEGVNFYGSGTEPFWNLSIDFSRGMQFTTLDSQDIQTPMGTPSQKDDGAYRKYEAVTEAGELIVQLEEGDCTDQMSGEEFDYVVTVMTKYSSDREYRTYKGCGEYVVDPRLHNIWVIEEFEGQKIDASTFSRGIPQIELNVRDDAYMGHDGCNTFRGGIRVVGNQIEFEPGPTTLMACEDNDVSNRISLALTESVYDFEIGRRLLLKKDGKTRFVLKNVD